MATYIRTLVSGSKARYIDKELDVDLDLAYITDRVIVMGYPASGIAGIYRNKREDTKRFLEHRHGKSFWVFNLCPLHENSYDSSFFDGRVSRYPFPDHHAPPLAILPLIAREMEIWLRGSEERVVAIHCKAGKGRSGTIACAYLLSAQFSTSPLPSQSVGSSEARNIATVRADELMDVMPHDEDAQKAVEGEFASPQQPHPEKQSLSLSVPENTTSPTLVTSPTALTISSGASTPAGARTPVEGSHSESLHEVLELHTSKRMRATDEKAKAKEKEKDKDKQKKGVSIPSQRRWLLYWSLLLANAGPHGMWGLRLAPAAFQQPMRTKIVSVNVRMREQRGAVPILARAINSIMDHGNLGSKRAPSSRASEVWVSLARYDDDLVNTLEKWEKQTRSDNGNLGVRKLHSDDMEGQALSDVFKTDKWDKEKMVKSFARFGASRESKVREDNDAQLGKVFTHTLEPLSESNWQTLQQNVATKDSTQTKDVSPTGDSGPTSEPASFEDLAQSIGNEVIVDPYREIRGKFYAGKVLFGWFWFIPAFHMVEPPTNGTPSSTTRSSLVLSRKEVDFPLGVGEALVDVEIVLEWHTTGSS